MAAFEARHLGKDKALTVLCFLQLKEPGLMLEDCRRLLSRSQDVRKAHGAIFGFFDRRGYVNGVFRAKVEMIGQTRCCLQIRDVIISDLLGKSLLLGMVEAVEQLAANLGCDEMTLPDASQDISGVFALFYAIKQRSLAGSGFLHLRN